MARNNKFDFSEFYVDDIKEEENLTQNDKEPEGVFACEEDYDRILNLASDDHQLAVDAKYPYLLISGFIESCDDVMTKEIEMMSDRLKKLEDSLEGIVKEEDRIDVAFNIRNDEYIVSRLPLTLDTILTIIAPHRYNVKVVSDSNNSFDISGSMLKGLMFT